MNENEGRRAQERGSYPWRTAALHTHQLHLHKLFGDGRVSQNSVNSSSPLEFHPPATDGELHKSYQVLYLIL